jgi:hypothetical protein
MRPFTSYSSDPLYAAAASVLAEAADVYMIVQKKSPFTRLISYTADRQVVNATDKPLKLSKEKAERILRTHFGSGGYYEMLPWSDKRLNY